MTDLTPEYASPANRDQHGEVVAYGPYPQCLVRSSWGATPATCQTLRQPNQNLISV